jgi:FkbM family methyltransferase
VDVCNERKPGLREQLCHSMPLIVAYRLSKFFLAHERKSGRQDFVASTLTGSLYGYRTGDLLADSVRMCGFWDWRAIAVASAVARRGGHIVEIGANTGTETVGLADIVGPLGCVTACEPSSANLDILRANIARNRLSHVRVIPVAVGETIGKARFRPSPIEGNSGMGYIDLRARPDSAGFDVEVVTLDSLELDEAALITIDVEGAEPCVLRGAKRYLERYRPTLYVEANGQALTRAGTSLGELKALLHDLHYEPFEIHRLTTRPLRAIAVEQEPDYIMNWLALPEEALPRRARINRVLFQSAFAPRVSGFHPLLQRERTATIR